MTKQNIKIRQKGLAMVLISLLFALVAVTAININNNNTIKTAYANTPDYRPTITRFYGVTGIPANVTVDSGTNITQVGIISFNNFRMMLNLTRNNHTYKLIKIPGHITSFAAFSTAMRNGTGQVIRSMNGHTTGGNLFLQGSVGENPTTGEWTFLYVSHVGLNITTSYPTTAISHISPLFVHVTIHTDFIISEHTATRNSDIWLNSALDTNDLRMTDIERWWSASGGDIEFEFRLRNWLVAIRWIRMYRTSGHITSWTEIMQRFNAGYIEHVGNGHLTTFYDDDTSIHTTVKSGLSTYFFFAYDIIHSDGFPARMPVAIHPQVIHVTFGDANTVPLPPPPTPPYGFYFAGWYLNSTFTMPYTGQPITSDTDLFARFSPINFTISYTLNGGSMSGQVNNFNITSSNITLPTPIRTHFNFMGWYTNAAFSGSSVTNIPTGSTGNRTFFARWTPQQFTITYSLNGGSLTAAMLPSFTIESANIILPSPTRHGFNFGGWFSNPHFTGSAISNIATGSTGNRSLYARWNIINFDITYNLNGGSMTGHPISFNIESDMITLPTPTREGHTFEGWFLSTNFAGTAITNIPAGSTGNRTLFARWEIIKHRVTFWVDGAIFSEVYVPHGMVLGNYNFLASGLQSVDMFSNAELTMPANLETPVVAAVTLFAVMPFGFYATLQFSVNGRIIRTETHSINTVLDDLLLTYEMQGFEFLGWFYDASFINPVEYGDRLTTNTTLYARFIPIEESRSRAWIIWLVVGIVAVALVAIVVVIIKKKRG